MIKMSYLNESQKRSSSFRAVCEHTACLGLHQNLKGTLKQERDKLTNCMKRSKHKFWKVTTLISKAGLDDATDPIYDD